MLFKLYETTLWTFGGLAGWQGFCRGGPVCGPLQEAQTVLFRDIGSSERIGETELGDLQPAGFRSWGGV